MCIRHAFRDSRDPPISVTDTIAQTYEYNLIKAEPWSLQLPPIISLERCTVCYFFFAETLENYFFPN